METLIDRLAVDGVCVRACACVCVCVIFSYIMLGSSPIFTADYVQTVAPSVGAPGALLYGLLLLSHSHSRYTPFRFSSPLTLMTPRPCLLILCRVRTMPPDPAAGAGAADGTNSSGVDESLYSRQLYVMGHEAQVNMQCIEGNRCRSK